MKNLGRSREFVFVLVLMWTNHAFEHITTPEKGAQFRDIQRCCKVSMRGVYEHVSRIKQTHCLTVGLIVCLLDRYEHVQETLA